MEKFLKNPRPYLLPPQPRPPCKLAVLGPPLSGKTTLCALLAQKYGAKVGLNFKWKLNGQTNCSYVIDFFFSSWCLLFKKEWSLYQTLLTYPMLTTFLSEHIFVGAKQHFVKDWHWKIHLSLLFLNVKTAFCQGLSLRGSPVVTMSVRKNSFLPRVVIKRLTCLRYVCKEKQHSVKGCH